MDNFLAHILVVDDDDGIRSLVKKFLNENNYLVTTADSAEDASDKIKIIKFDFNSYNFYKKNSSLKIHLKQKKKQILNSIAVLSFGSTFNIESSILNKPTFHLDFSDVKRKNDLYQYSNFSKNLDEFEYLKSYKCKNIIKNSKPSAVISKTLINFFSEEKIKVLKMQDPTWASEEK